MNKCARVECNNGVRSGRKYCSHRCNAIDHDPLGLGKVECLRVMNEIGKAITPVREEIKKAPTQEEVEHGAYLSTVRRTIEKRGKCIERDEYGNQWEIDWDGNKSEIGGGM